ncbi:hypothetical protein [Actinophytocola sp.]|uniref:hypothetical protein n=1 Tax=Actinophytocola sp. TaxID=1872138 RepID=UPI00389A6111
MLALETFADALRGNAERLRQEAGAGALICVAPELSSVFVVGTADGKQTGTVAVVERGLVGAVELPRSFQVREVARDGGQFVLTSADGRVARGTPEQFTTWTRIVAEGVNPRFDEHLAEILVNTHQIPVRDLAGADDTPATDPALRNVEEISRVGEAMVTVGDEEVWLTFENAWPEKVVELVPHVRELLAALETLGRTGAEFLLARTTTAQGSDEDRAEFLARMRASSLVVYLSGDFELHYEGVSGTYYLDGYWPSVQFLANGTPVDHAIEA